jgi:hypothetical protein
MEEAGQRILAGASMEHPHTTASCTPRVDDISKNLTLKRKRDDSSHIHGDSTCILQEKDCPNTYNVNSWTAIQDTYSMMKNQSIPLSLDPIQHLLQIPIHLSSEMSRQGLPQLFPFQDDRSRSALNDCEQKIEKTLQDIFPPPRHRILTREYQRAEFSNVSLARQNSVQTTGSGNDTSDPSHPIDPRSQLETYLKEYEKLQEQRLEYYLLPRRF